MKYKKVSMQDSSHLYHIFKKNRPTHTDKNKLSNFQKENKAQKKPLGQRPQIFLYKPTTFSDTVSLISRAWDMKSCVPQVSRIGTLPGQGGKSIQSCCCRADLSSILSFKTKRTSAKMPLWLAAAALSLGRQSNLLSKELPRSKI